MRNALGTKRIRRSPTNGFGGGFTPAVSVGGVRCELDCCFCSMSHQRRDTVGMRTGAVQQQLLVWDTLWVMRVNPRAPHGGAALWRLEPWNSFVTHALKNIFFFFCCRSSIICFCFFCSFPFLLRHPPCGYAGSPWFLSIPSLAASQFQPEQGARVNRSSASLRLPPPISIFCPDSSAALPLSRTTRSTSATRHAFRG